jgi:hypothetical protein
MFKNDDEAAGYLGAIIDGEGTVTFRSVPRGYDRRITIYNTEESIIDAATAALAQLGIAFRVYEINRTPRPEHLIVSKTDSITHIVISRKENLELVLAKVPIKSDRKLNTLKSAVATYVGRWREHV